MKLSELVQLLIAPSVVAMQQHPGQMPPDPEVIFDVGGVVMRVTEVALSDTRVAVVLGD